MRARTPRLLIALALLALPAACASPTAPEPPPGGGGNPVRPTPGDAVITVKPSVDIGEPFVGWGGTAGLAFEPWEPNYSTFATWGPQARALLVNELGFTDIRVQLSAGIESDGDYFQIAWDTNDKPFWGGTGNRDIAKDTDRFFFSSIDVQIDNVVAPMRQLILARGETPTVILHSHGGGELGKGPPWYDSTVDDIGNGKNGRQKMANRILETYKHLWVKYGWIPDAVDPVNEPDANQSWTTIEFADLVLRIGQTLEAGKASFGQGATWHPVIFAPSTAYLANFATFFDATWNYQPGSGYPNRAWIRAAAYHPYDANRPNWTFGPLNNRIAASGLPAHMPEYTGLTASLAHRILVDVPETVRLHRFALSGWFNVTGGGTGVELTGHAKLFRNYSHYVRPGAQRKGVSHNAQATFCDGIPWLDPDGRMVVVVQTTGSGTCWVDGLPAGTWGINYGLGTDTNPTANTNSTAVTEWNRELPQVTLTQGSALPIPVAGTGVYTVYRK